MLRFKISTSSFA